METETTVLYTPPWEGKLSLDKRISYFMSECTNKQFSDVNNQCLISDKTIDYIKYLHLRGPQSRSDLLDYLKKAHDNSEEEIIDKLFEVCADLNRTKPHFQFSLLIKILGKKPEKMLEDNKASEDFYSQSTAPLLDQTIDFHNPQLTPALLVFSEEATQDQMETLNGLFADSLPDSKTKNNCPIKFLMKMSMGCNTVNGLLNILDDQFGESVFPQFKEKVGVKQSNASGGQSIQRFPQSKRHKSFIF